MKIDLMELIVRQHFDAIRLLKASKY